MIVAFILKQSCSQIHIGTDQEKKKRQLREGNLGRYLSLMYNRDKDGKVRDC